MKTTPSLMVAGTAVAALAAGVLLAAEDRLLFEPQQAMLVGIVDDAVSLWSEPAASPYGRTLTSTQIEHASRRSTLRASAGAQEAR